MPNDRTSVPSSLPAQEQISRRLEPEKWRTTQRENRKDYEQRETAGRWGRILDAIIGYQNRHAGQSPSDQSIASLTGLSLGQVGYHLHEMQKEGFITDTRGFPRTITVHMAKKGGLIPPQPAGKSKVVEEADVIKQTEGTEGKVRVRNKRVSFYSRAKQLAQAIVDYQDKHGVYPGVSDVGEMVYGYRSAGGASALIRQMTERGWVHHKNRHHGDLCLTALGRAALFGEMKEPMHTDIVAKPRSMSLAQAAEAPSPPAEEPRPQVIQPAPVGVVPPVPSVRPGFSFDALREEMAKPVALEIRRAQPVADAAPDLNGVGDVDLIIALTSRGYKVSR